jgi:vancomycin resistance protein YoaR
MDMKKNVIMITAILVALGTTSIPVGYVSATGQNWSNVVYPGVYIEDIDVSGKELSQVEKLIEEKYEKPALSRKIEIQANDRTYVLDYGKLQVSYNASEVAKAAFSYGKEGNIIQKFRIIRAAEKKEFKLKFAYNPNPIDELIEEIEKDTNKAAVNASVTINKGDIKINPEVNGAKIEKDKLKQAIVGLLEGDASSESKRVLAPVEVIKPELTSEKLSAINSKVSSFSTNFSASAANRINNINLATKAINGTLLMPGESFSFNEIVGQRTVARGYREAGVIIDNQLDSGIGGGICQVSSTLYYAILKANLKATERRNHSLPLSYIGKGLDATVDWGNIDLKFTNTLEVPVYIEGYLENKNVYFNLYSSQELTKKTYEMITEVYNTVQPTVKYIDDPNLYEGQTEVVKKSSVGYKVKTYRKTFENGKLVNTELISSDNYKVVNGEIKVGTKKITE